MNTINEQTATLTKLIAEIVELDSDNQCLSVELDYLIKHLQGYKRTCEECVAMEEYKCPTDCECADCEKNNELCQDCRKRPKYDDGVCEKCYAIRLGCDSEEEEDKIDKIMGILNTRVGWHETTHTLIREVELLRGKPLCRHCELPVHDLDISYDGYICDECKSDDENIEYCVCEGCRCWKEEWGDEEGTTRVCEDATCGKEFSIFDIHYYDDDQCLCYCCVDCYKNDSKDGEEEEEDSDWDGDLDDTPNCHQCGEDCGRSIIAHQKYKKTYFCSEECNREYDGEDE